MSEKVKETAEQIKKETGAEAVPFIGDTTNADFRKEVFKKR